MRVQELFIRPALALFGALVMAGLFANACGDSPTSPTGNANLAIRLTDAPIDEVDQVNIYFTSVTVKPEGRSVEHQLPLQLAENPVNLLALTDRTIDFAAGVVEPGRYEFMHINIDEGRSSVLEDGARKSLRVPSREVKIVGGFTVDNDHKTTITLDFDARSSLNHLGNGQWLLQPIVVITDTDTSSR